MLGIADHRLCKGSTQAGTKSQHSPNHSKSPGLGIENMNWTASLNRTIRALGALDPEWPKTWRLRGDQAGSWGFQAE